MHIVVTGASSGIGEALALEYANAGANVTLVARREAKLKELAASLNTRTHVAARDLSDAEQVLDWIDDAEAALGPIDILVNNAGVQFVEPSPEMDCGDGEMLLAVNLMSPLRLIRQILPRMIERGSGSIINVASLAALAPTAGMTYYNSSKGGLAAASEAMRGEIKSKGVHVLTVYPGPIRTPMGNTGAKGYEDSFGLRMQQWGTVDVLARLIRRAQEKRRPRLIYPRVYSLTRWFPGVTRFFMDRFTPAVKSRSEQ